MELDLQPEEGSCVGKAGTHTQTVLVKLVRYIGAPGVNSSTSLWPQNISTTEVILPHRNQTSVRGFVVETLLHHVTGF